MHDTLVFALLNGTPDSPRPWSQEDEITFICPVPGYDRHFALTQKYGIKMVTVDMRDDGPDVAAVRELVKDPVVKGMWVVPTYSNPAAPSSPKPSPPSWPRWRPPPRTSVCTGTTPMRVHHLTEERTKSADILGLCAASGHAEPPLPVRVDVEDHLRGRRRRVLCVLAGQRRVVPRPSRQRTIGPDKVNHLRHALLLGESRRRRRTHGSAPGDPRAEVRGSARDPLTSGSARYGVATWSGPRAATSSTSTWSRERPPRRPARQGGRHRADAGRVVVPVRQGPARPEHPARPVVPDDRRAADGDGGRRHLRAAGRR